MEICSEESAGGLSQAGYAYENREGDSKQYLPEALSENTPVLMEKGDYRISFHPVAIPEAGIQPEENGESPVESSGNLEEVNFHLRTRADTPLLRTEYQTCNKHLLLTEKSG